MIKKSKTITLDVGKSEYLPKLVKLLYMGCVENDFANDKEKDEFLKILKKYL